MTDPAAMACLRAPHRLTEILRQVDRNDMHKTQLQCLSALQQALKDRHKHKDFQCKIIVYASKNHNFFLSVR